MVNHILGQEIKTARIGIALITAKNPQIQGLVYEVTLVLSFSRIKFQLR
jgi:hypothetical protein